MATRITVSSDNYLEALRQCGGYYNCPKDKTGKRLGPLVGYAGKYEGPQGEQLQWVGDTYANFAQIECNHEAMRFVSGCLGATIDARIGVRNVDFLCGVPLGGYDLAAVIGQSHNIDVIKAEKKVTAIATESSREKSKLVFGRHGIETGASYVLMEDVCNNFSTTGDLIRLIVSFGGKVMGIACFLNRSLIVDKVFSADMGPEASPLEIPVISLVRLPIPEYKQNEASVAEDVAGGNVIWKPKDEWDKLAKVMDAGNRE